MSVQEIQILRLPSSEFAPVPDLPYIDVFHLHPLYDKLFGRANTVLVGPPGIGKSLSIAAYAAKINCPLITFDCSEAVRRGHLIGKFIIRGNETPFVLGELTTAFEVVNEVGRCILNFEEINALTPQMQKVLNPVLDFRRKIEAKEALKVFRIKPGAKLWCTGTMNTAVFGGVYQMNGDLKSRVRLLVVEYPKPEQEKVILRAALGDKLANHKSEKDADDLITRVITLAHETRQQAFEYALSPRDVVQIVDDVIELGLPGALALAMGKFEVEDRATFKKRVHAIFHINIGW